MANIVVDPITRIEGHLRIEVQTDSGNRITSASSSGTMMRGIELILQNRDPRDAWAFTQRICGVCTVVHALTSIRAVENALNYPIPTNARHIRNLMMGAQLVQDQVTHFYQLTSMDWIDVVSATTADPVATAELQRCVSPAYTKGSATDFANVKQKLVNFVSSGQLGLFGNAYWGHPGYKLPPEVNLMLFAHWLEALAWQRRVLKLHAIFGGRNPHPSFVVGGVPCTIATAPIRNSAGASTVAVDPAAMTLVQSCIDDMRAFVRDVLLPDVKTVARFYKDWFGRGEGLGNFLCFGEYPLDNATNPTSLFVPNGAILGRNLATVHPVDLRNPAEIQEFISSSWYEYSAGKSAGLHPSVGETKPVYGGPTQPYAALDTTQPYSWDKTPRWKGNPMEVGPLARVLVMYAKGNARVRDQVNASLAELKQPLSAMYSTMGRMLAQAIDTHVVAEELQVWFDALKANIARGDLTTHNAALFDPASWPASAQGVGFTEAPRGALGHWVSIASGRIANYQCVVPTTWNASPRDSAQKASAYEAALSDGKHTLAVPGQPLEILRTIHSFNPCMACAVHVLDADARQSLRVTVKG